jgi:hypothetical protein
MGRYYGALSLGYEALPILQISAFVIANLRDPSFLVGPGLTWSVADNVEFVAGAFLAFGRRPDDLEALDLLNEDLSPVTEAQAAEIIHPGSEFGLSPHGGYAQLKAYF